MNSAINFQCPSFKSIPLWFFANSCNAANPVWPQNESNVSNNICNGIIAIMWLDDVHDGNDRWGYLLLLPRTRYICFHPKHVEWLHLEHVSSPKQGQVASLLPNRRFPSVFYREPEIQVKMMLDTYGVCVCVCVCVSDQIELVFSFFSAFGTTLTKEKHCTFQGLNNAWRSHGFTHKFAEFLNEYPNINQTMNAPLKSIASNVQLVSYEYPRTRISFPSCPR